MDWARAIAINQTALTRIVAELIAIVGLVGDSVVAKLSRPTYYAVLRTLRPAEAAVRRLIVIAARGLKLDLPPSRPRPARSKGRAVEKKGLSPLPFQLFDTRKNFDRPRRKYIPDHKAPRVWSPFSDPHLSPLFQPRPGPRAAPPKAETVDASRLSRRLMAIKQALTDLPAQAQRLVRWKARRQAMAAPKFRDPMRPGRPPGHRKTPRDDVDWVLKECHALARDALRDDSS